MAQPAFTCWDYSLIKPKFTATAQLIRYEAPGKSEMFKTTPVSGDTFSAIIRAPELVQEVCQTRDTADRA